MSRYLAAIKSKCTYVFCMFIKHSVNNTNKISIHTHTNIEKQVRIIKVSVISSIKQLLITNILL